MAWLIDTNILSEWCSPKAEERALDFVASASLAQLYVSIHHQIQRR
jgi:hypothetical protein